MGGLGQACNLRSEGERLGERERERIERRTEGSRGEGGRGGEQWAEGGRKVGRMEMETLEPATRLCFKSASPPLHFKLKRE